MSNYGGLGIYSAIPQANTDDVDSDLDLDRLDRQEMDSPERTRVDMEDVDDVDMVEILPQEKAVVDRRMSPLRRVLFGMSLVLCFLTAVTFLWVLPCQKPPPSKSAGWENPYHDVELKGAIAVVEGAPGRARNLILLYRGDVVDPSRASEGDGVVQVVGDSGRVGWFVRLPHAPSDLDCSIIDVDRDGRKDCLAQGDAGLLLAFDPLSGRVHWYLHPADGSAPFDEVEFPLVLADVDGDGVDDLVAAAAPARSARNALAFVSGRTGAVIGVPKVVAGCASVSRLRADGDRALSFVCRNNASLAESSQFVQFEELRKDVTNEPPDGRVRHRARAAQHRPPGPTEDRKNAYSVDGRRLTVENRGRCPESCRATVRLVDGRGGNGTVAWQYDNLRVHGTVPATLSFEGSRPNGKIAGFVLKFWQWNAGPKKPSGSAATPTPAAKKKGRGPKKGVPDVTVNHLTERVVLVTFNATDVHVVNASQSDIIQMCFEEGGETVCQPDMAHQESSLAIADLDGDGSRELITYLSSFVCTETASLDEYYGDSIKCDGEWRLRSTVRTVRLEAELPKLYEAVSRHR